MPLNQGFAAKVRGTCVFSVSVEFPSHPYPLPSLNKMQILTISLNLVISHVTPELDSGNPPYAFQNVKTLAKCSLWRLRCGRRQRVGVVRVGERVGLRGRWGKIPSPWQTVSSDAAANSGSWGRERFACRLRVLFENVASELWLTDDPVNPLVLQIKPRPLSAFRTVSSDWKWGLEGGGRVRSLGGNGE